jgi:hypothetical protein
MFGIKAKAKAAPLSYTPVLPLFFKVAIFFVFLIFIYLFIC